METKQHATKKKNQWIKEEIKTYVETDENENTTFQNAGDAAKAILRGKFIAIQADLQKREKFQVNNLSLLLKEREKKGQTKPTVNSRKEIGAERKRNRNFKTIEKIDKNKSRFLKRKIKETNL